MDEFRAARLGGLADPVDLVHREGVHDHNVARPEGRPMRQLHVDPEHRAVHTAIHTRGSGHPRLAQPGYAPGQLPAVVWHCTY